MRILYIDRDTDRARELYSQILSYKGVHWDLLHSTTLVEASAWLERDQFDLVLLSVYEEDRAAGGYETFIRQQPTTPVVVLTDSDDHSQHANFVKTGANDCLSSRAINGGYLMRRLRIAVSRFHCNVGRRAPGAAAARPPAARTTATASVTPTVEPAADHIEGKLRVAAEFASSSLTDVGTTVVLNEPESVALLVNDTSSHFSLESNSHSQYVSVDSLTDACELFRKPASRFSAVIVEQGVLEREGIDELLNLEKGMFETPLIVVMVDRATSVSIPYIEKGIDDCVLAASTSQAMIERTVLLTRTRLEREFPPVESAVTANAPISDRRSKDRGGRDRRRGTRYLCSQPILAIPVLPNGAPDKSQICEALTIDIATTGIGIQLPGSQVVPSRNWVVGINCDTNNEQGHQLHFANVVVRNVSYPAGGIRIGASFQHPMDDLLRPQNLQPRLCGDSHQLVPELSFSVLDDWCEVGVMRRVLMQRIHSCPECSAVAAIGNGCRECGSARYEFQNLIHHFACAYFGLEDEFETEHGLACPKCRMKGLVAGADFELIKARYQCADCGFESNELEQVCNCLNCQLRFPLRMAREERVFGYDVERLDILAYLSSAP